MISLARTSAFLKSFPRLTIGLVGDLFLDRYLHLSPGVEELSIETGLEAYQIDRVRNSPGALGTVMNNLAALGVGLLVPVSVVGDDGHGYDLLKEVRRLPCDPSHLLCWSQRLTPTYTKPLRQVASGAWHELNRLDVRTRAPLAANASAAVCEHLRQVFHSSDGMIVLDQINETDWGVINGEVRATLAELADERPDKLIYVDSRAHLQQFQKATLKGNCGELLAAGKALGWDTSDVKRIAKQLADRQNRPVFATQGEAGILVAERDGDTHLVPGLNVPGPFDIVGAGDSATSGIVAAKLAGATDVEAAAFGNLVASITVQQLGTTGTASPDQVLTRWQIAAQQWPKCAI